MNNAENPGVQTPGLNHSGLKDWLGGMSQAPKSPCGIPEWGLSRGYKTLGTLTPLYLPPPPAQQPAGAWFSSVSGSRAEAGGGISK